MWYWILFAFVYVMGAVLALLYMDAAIIRADLRKHWVQNMFYVSLWPFAVFLSLTLGLAELVWYYIRPTVNDIRYWWSR